MRQVAGNADKALAQKNVGILDQPEDAFPHEHRFFTSSDIGELYSAVHWVQDDRPRYHDALTAGLIMRKRGGRRSNDLFEVGHLLLTRNPQFPPVAKRVTVSKNYISQGQVGPVVHLRQFATAIWLRAGLGVADQEVPRRYILSACRRVLTLRKNIVERIRHEARTLETAEREQLELLLSVGRSTQVLMDKTLGSAQVIDSTNVAYLVEQMRKAVASEAYADADKKIKALQEDQKRETAALTCQLDEAQTEITRERSHANELEEQVQRLLEERVKRSVTLLNGLNIRLRKRRKFLAVMGYIAAALFAAAPFVISSNGLSVTLLLYALALVLQFTGFIKGRIFDPIIRALDKRSLQRELARAALDIGSIPFEIAHTDDGFVKIPIQDVED